MHPPSEDLGENRETMGRLSTSLPVPTSPRDVSGAVVLLYRNFETEGSSWSLGTSLLYARRSNDLTNRNRKAMSDLRATILSRQD